MWVPTLEYLVAIPLNSILNTHLLEANIISTRVCENDIQVWVSDTQVSETKFILLIQHSSVDFYHLSVYADDTTTHDFRDRLPIRGMKGYPRVTQSHNKVDHEIPLRYTDAPGITEWP